MWLKYKIQYKITISYNWVDVIKVCYDHKSNKHREHGMWTISDQKMTEINIATCRMMNWHPKPSCGNWHTEIQGWKKAATYIDYLGDNDKRTRAEQEHISDGQELNKNIIVTDKS